MRFRAVPRFIHSRLIVKGSNRTKFSADVGYAPRSDFFCLAGSSRNRNTFSHIDDDRSTNAFGLVMSLNMLIETADGSTTLAPIARVG